MALQKTQTGEFANLLLVDGCGELEIELLQPFDIGEAGQLRPYFDIALLPRMIFALQDRGFRRPQWCGRKKGASYASLDLRSCSPLPCLGQGAFLFRAGLPVRGRLSFASSAACQRSAGYPAFRVGKAVALETPKRPT